MTKSLPMNRKKSVERNRGKDIKGFMTLLALLAWLTVASAYTSEQANTLEGMRLSFELGLAYQAASQGQNAAEFNALVEEYNAWIRQNFGEDPTLLMSKIDIGDANSLNPMPMLPYLTSVSQRRPFNSSSDLSKFGKQQVLTQISPSKVNTYEADSAMANLENF